MFCFCCMGLTNLYLRTYMQNKNEFYKMFALMKFTDYKYLNMCHDRSFQVDISLSYK